MVGLVNFLSWGIGIAGGGRWVLTLTSSSSTTSTWSTSHSCQRCLAIIITTMFLIYHQYDQRYFLAKGWGKEDLWVWNCAQDQIKGGGFPFFRAIIKLWFSNFFSSKVTKRLSLASGVAEDQLELFFCFAGSSATQSRGVQAQVDFSGAIFFTHFYLFFSLS